MEFKEFSNPLDKDYDINASLSGNSPEPEEPKETVYDKQANAILEEIGLLDEEELKKANISFDEYLTPTSATIAKLKAYRDSLVQEKTENIEKPKTV